MEVVERSLEQIETSLDARVVLAVDAGAYGEGTPSADSPYCIQFVYVHRLDWYLQLTPGADRITLPVSDDFTLTGWDIGLLLRTMKNGDAEKTGWLRSAVVYRADADVLARLRGFSERSWQRPQEFARQLERAKALSGTWRFGSDTTTHDFVKAMRAILATRWIAEDRGAVPCDFGELRSGLDDDLNEELGRLLQANAEASAETIAPQSPRSQVFFGNELRRLMDVEIGESAQADLPPFDRLYAELVRRFG